MRVVLTSINAVFIIAAILILGLIGPFSSAGAAALYKWVDENGQIRYSDRLPVSQTKKKHQQLSTQGVVLSTTEEAKSDEERAIEDEAQRKLEEQQSRDAMIKQAQDKQDRVLILTFSNEEELSLARDNRLDVLESVIQLINKSIASTVKKLDHLKKTANTNYTLKNKEIPGGLAQKIEHFTRKIENRSGQLALKQNEMDKINEQYDIDLARFRLLKSEAE